MRLRPYRHSDAKYIVQWAKDELVFRQWSAGKLGEYPLTEERLCKHYDDVFASSDKDFFALTAVEDDGEVIGHLIMRNPGEDRDELRFGFVIVDSNIRGRGIGRQMLDLAMKYAFEVYGALKVDLGVFENNPSAHRCYKASGMHETGDTFSINVDGEDWNCIVLEKTAEEYFC